MWPRTLLLLSVFIAGCSAYFLGTALSLAIDSIFPALIAAVCLPVIGARVGGLDDLNRLALIAAYALVGWILAYSLAPQVAGIRHVPLSPGVIESTYIFSSAVSTILSLVGSAFAPRHLLKSFSRWDYIQATLACLVVSLSLVPATLYVDGQPARELGAWRYRVQTDLHKGIDNPPPGVEVKEWNLMIGSTENALFNCFSTPEDINDHRRFHDFSGELRRYLAFPLSVDTLRWIWDEIEVISTRGQAYSKRYRPTTLERVD